MLDFPNLRGFVTGVFAQRSSYRSFSAFGAVICALSIALILLGCASAGPKTPAPEGVLSLSATSFNFNTVVVGNNATQTLNIKNTGKAPLTLESLTLKSQQFQITGPSVPRTILPNQGVNYSVSFVPTTSGNESASLQITTNVAKTPVAVSLAGVGEKAFAALQVTPASINFGNLNLKSTGTQNVTLKNTGDINMTVSGITVAGSGFGYSDLSPGFSLAPNQTVTFQVWFKPQTAGAASGTVTILSSNIASPEDIPVSGDGVNPTPPPSTPTPVQHSVALSWQPSTSTVTGYRVYRSTVSGSGFSPLTPATNALSYTDNTVADGTTYYYVVTAVDASGDESPYSNQVTAVIPAS